MPKVCAGDQPLALSIHDMFRPMRAAQCTGVLVFLLRQRERLFQDVQRDGGFVLADDERRTEPQRGFAAAQHHQAALEGQGLHAVAQRGGRLAGGLVLHQFDADHQAASAHVAHQRMRLLPAVAAAPA